MMSKVVLLAIYISLGITVLDGIQFVSNISESAENELIETRSGRFYPFSIGIVRFENGPCQSANNLTGTCYTRRQCRRVPGIASGTCARRVGVCCVVQRSCGTTSSANNTYFINPGFPNGYSGGTRCTMTIQRCNADICQLRLDFYTLNLGSPNAAGHCVNDALTITGAASIIPPICGYNTGQHMYLDFNGDTDINLIIETSSAVSMARYWNIKATQIECESSTRAPSGCLMYYTTLSGTVNSFNYGTAKNSDADDTGTREIANLNYGVCIAMAPDYCSIRWSQGPDPTSFTVSGDTNAGTGPEAALSGSICTTDFVVIPHPFDDMGVALDTDRFCGNGFTTKTTSSKPFVLTVVTDNDETDDIANRGFSLNFQQIRCSTPRLS